MISLEEIPVSLSMTLSSGKTLELKRCACFFDLFSDEKGRIFRLDIPSIYDNNGTPSIRYHTQTMQVLHLVAAAHKTDIWERVEEASIDPIDGNRWNTSPDNIYLNTEPSKGRRGRSHLRHLFEAFQIALLTNSLTVAAEEKGFSTTQLLESMIKFVPWMLGNGDMEGVPEDLTGEQIGNRALLASLRRTRLVRRGQIGESS